MPAKTKQTPNAASIDKADANELTAMCKQMSLLSTGTEGDLRKRVKTGYLLTTAIADASEEASKASADLAAAVGKSTGLAKLFRELNFVETISTTLKTSGKVAGPARASACALVSAVLVACGKPALPIMLPLLAPLLDLTGDKIKAPREAANAAVETMMGLTTNYAATLLLPQLLVRPSLWLANMTRLNYITKLCTTCPEATVATLSYTLPVIAEELHDLKAKVRDAATECMKALCALCQNEDVAPLVPTLMSALENASEIVECVNTLASTTFVQTVDEPTLSIMAPILVRGFANRKETCKRACARIVENMVKLVENPVHLAATFLPKILPKLESAREHVSDPEARKVCDKACKALVARATLKKGQHLPGSAADLLTTLKGELKTAGDDEDAMVYLTYVSELLSALVNTDSMDQAVWTETLTPYLTCVVPADEAATAIAAVLAKAIADKEESAEEEEKIEGEELCNCEFSLAYGNKVLLRKTKLRLVRGQNYGLIGKNDSGKTSLMRAIADHRVDGFPEEDELRTVFVETDIQGELSDLSVLDYIMADKVLAKLNIPREEMSATLNKVGFTADSPANVDTTVGALSGGWKMKLALARAMLLDADILLLDEPTNHLDSYNVKWVEDYLAGLENVTCVMVSHDSGFLNRICQNIIQINNFGLSFHRGNLESFVAKNPDAKSFFELKTEKFSFSFPQPARLKGINSKGKPIMKMTDISFTYPGAPKPQLNHVTIQVSLGSRVACVGVNGAGKSTMIKLLTGELEPDEGSGEVWTHPNMIYGYIAQHAFHHIESHLDKTPNEYICWRYRHGNDREALNKITNIVSEEEQKAMDKPVAFDLKNPETGLTTKMKGVVKSLTLSRRENKLKKDQEYEVKLVGNETGTYWILRSVLLKAGWEKVLKQVDDKITIRESMFQNPLTKVNVTKHLLDVGLEEEFSTHMRIGALSGGQKVKVVLGAALWNRPHVLILDEPTNYLDRDSLGALAAAIRQFEGGVVMITHNSQFCDNLCPQVWHLENNTLNVKGDAEWMNMEKLADESKKPKTAVDKFGNTIEIKVTFDDLPKKEQKRLKKNREKVRKACRKAGGDVEELEFDDGYDFDEF